MQTAIRTTLVATSLAALVLVGTAAVPSATLSDASAEGSGNARPGGAPAADPARVRGARYFDQAIAWINDGKPGISEIHTFFCHMHDVQLDIRDTHQEGYLRIWFKAPDKFRQEWRQERDLRLKPPATTKILAGQRMWIVSPDGTPRRVHGTAGGAASVQQLQDDRNRLADLAVFLTLAGLKGEGVIFEDMGQNEGPAGTVFQGRWHCVRRILEDGADMIFYFAYRADAEGRTASLTYPGIVVVRGDRAKQEPTEAYILSNWKQGTAFQYPGKIEAYAREDWAAEPRYKRFLLAFPEDIQINVKLSDRIFDDPMQR